MNSRFRNERGFTLIELAIVLVIIGIILGAVLKGQDLVNNAKSKKFITWVKAWEIASWQYMDRKGYFPGDNNTNGLIGEASDADPIAAIAAANFAVAPDNTTSLGSLTFYIFMGYDNASVASPVTNKNVIVICKDPTCSQKFVKDELNMLEALDTAIDGTANPAKGNVLGMRGTTNGSPSGRKAGGIFANGDLEPTTDWNENDVALVYYFDRPSGK